MNHFQKIFFYFFLLLVFIPKTASGDQLDIGQDINFEYRTIKRGSLEDTQFRQKIKLYMDAYLRDGIQIGGTLNSSGIMNSTLNEIIYEGSEIENLSPFFEKAYIKINDYYGYPVSLSFGKLPLKWAEGVLVNDNERGVPAVKVGYDAPYNIKGEAYYLRTRNNLLNISGIDGSGIRASRDFGPRNIELNYVQEKYEDDVKVKRTIYGGTFSQDMFKGLEYSLMGFLMDGEKGDTSFNAHALGAYGKFEGVVDPIGKGGAWIRYIYGSGDTKDDDMGFKPVLSLVEADMIGDFYGRNREKAMIDGTTSNSVTLSHSIANVSAIRYALYATLRDEISLYMVRSTYKKVNPDLPLGGAITLGIHYYYSFLNFELAHTTFVPEDAYDGYEGDKKTKFLSVTVSGSF